jgi:hypothetical protein
MSNKIARDGDSGVMYVPDVGAAYFSIGKVTSENYANTSAPSGRSSWESDVENVLGKLIVSYGARNNLPAEIRDIFDVNNLSSSIIEREIGLLWGQGPQLYKEDIVAVNEYEKRIVLAEVKRNKDKIKRSALQQKASSLIKNFNKYSIEYLSLSLDEM